MKKRDEDKSTKVHSQSHSQSVVESDLNRAGEDHPQRPEAVAESVTQTAMEVDEPTTVPVKTKPTPRVILDRGVDSHFHLDRLARRVRGEKFMCKSMALSSVLQEASPKNPPLLQLQMAVASFCDRPFQLRLQKEMRAEKDKSRTLLEDLQRDPRLRLSFGLHPKCVSPLIFRVTEEAKRLKMLLSLPNTVAFGEVGLDYTEPEADWQEQRLFLEQLLGLMKGSLDQIPVVVHCRENNIPKRSARDDLCGILETYLGRDQEIQLHYFNGKLEDVEFWLNAFPNAHFSVSGMVGRFNQEQKEALVRIPPERLLLETDAPFCPLLASGTEIMRRPYSTPYTIDLVATCVGRILKKTRAEVLKITTQNAQRFFRSLAGRYCPDGWNG